MRKIFGLSLFSVAVFAHAQNIGNSPYASYSMGDMKYDNSVEHSGMAGLTTAYVSDFNSGFNFINPAANQNLQLATIKFEATNENNYYTTDYDNYSGKKHSNYLSNIVIAFPVSSKLKFGMGYQPYASKSYSALTSDQSNASTSRLSGTGTISTVQTAVSYQLNSKFSLGLRTNYYFGNVTDTNEIYTSNTQYINGKKVTNTLKNFNFTLGTTFQHTTEDDKKLTVGATATLGNMGSSTTNYKNSTYIINSYNEHINETVIEEQSLDGKKLFPFEASLGVGYGHHLKWFMGSQVNYKNSYETRFQGQNHTMKSGVRVAIGGWYLPNYNNFRNYFDRITYRAGAYYDKSGLIINGTDINEFGITLGASFPFKNTSINRITGLDFAVEFGKRGTTQNNLINQNFINLKFGFNFADRWFVKTVYN